jgi:hypothetical protein
MKKELDRLFFKKSVTMHMGYKEFCDFISFEVGLAMRLESKLTKGTFGTIEH